MPFVSKGLSYPKYQEREFQITHNTQIYDIRRFVNKAIYTYILSYSIINFLLSLGRPVLMKM